MAATEQREYETTHGFISFRVDLHNASPVLWALLGEAKSKSEHIARTLLKPEASHELMQVFLTKGALATTAIEGNTLSEQEARRVIDNTSRLPRSKEYLAQEIRNVVNAYNVVKNELMTNPDFQISPHDLCCYNELILEDLELEEGVVPGEIRDYSVTVGGGIYRAAPARDCEYLLERLCEWMNGSDFDPPAGQQELAAPLAIIKAIVAHLYLAWIHPFGDGNGRTARLLELWVLLRAGFPTPATQLLSNHYNVTRQEYYRQLNQASRTGDPRAFIEYASQGFVDGLRDQLNTIWQQQFGDRWEQYVYQRFGDATSDSQRRRRRLVLDMSKEQHPVPRSELRYLTKKLAAMYDGKTDKTLTRDLNALRDMGLIRRAGRGYIAEDSVILGFLPQRNDGVLNIDIDALRQPVSSPVVLASADERGA